MWFQIPKFITVERRIAVTGTGNAGKTVFLTSLINHLIEHDPVVFAFGERATIRRLRVEPPGGSREAFDYAAFRDALARHKRWPRKTRDATHFACQFERSDWRLATNKLHFFDFPGERIADAAIAGMPRYEDWSDHLLRHFAGDSAYRDAVEPYLALQKQTSLSAASVVEAYKKALAALVLQYKPLISPSTFLLDQRGQTPESRTAEALVNERYSGLVPADGNDRQFAPLSRNAREAHPQLARNFARYYAEYRRQVALPLFRDLRGCGRLAVLIDIPTVLAGGVGRYNDTRQILADLFDALRDDSLVGRLLRLVSLSPVLDRVAFVASKADLVHPKDVEAGRLHALLGEMTERFSRLLPHVTFKSFAVGAVVSTRIGSGNHRLIGRLAYDNPERREVEFPVSEVPTQWPSSWEPGDYAYYRVYPDVPENRQLPPRHFGLDAVFDFLTRE